VSDKPGPFLFDQTRRELEQESAIDPAVIAERRYESIHRPTNGDQRQRERLHALQIPTWAIKEDSYFPGLLIPMYGPTGRKVSCQWKPRRPVPNRDGKPMKYASPRGQASRIDVHPRNRDKIADPTTELWITEGIKKADALTSKGLCVIALTGVFNWRSTLGTLGDWEDVPLKGRSVVICFDADARSNPNVLRAMIRLGNWLRSQGAAKIGYLIVPAAVRGKPVKGADDFFAAGGSLEELKAAATAAPPPETADDTFSDARLAETIADDVLTDQFIWVTGLGWMRWDSRCWATATDVEVTEEVRGYVLEQFNEAVNLMRAGQLGNPKIIDGWHSMLSAGRMRSVLTLARGIVARKADDLDSDPDLLNTPSGIVDLQRGELLPHDPSLLITRITSGSYRPGFTHPDWEKALQALPEAERSWFQVRIGQGITGHTTPDGVTPVLQGAGENGKSAVTTDGVVPALGGCASMASPKLFQASKGTEHSTERAELRGKRLLIAEELTEGRSLDITALKQIQDVGTITARYVHKDNFEFQTSHSLFTTTNYIPVVSETDHGTWRRLALLCFPYTFRKPGEPLHNDNDRVGDPTLKGWIRRGADGRHDAIATWAVEGAMRWYADPDTALMPTTKIKADTRAWRADADRILGFWGEKLIGDRDACILTTEMLEAFNSWLQGDGHNEWSKELFGPRFVQHEETIRHGVEVAQPRHPKGLSRYGFSGEAPPRQARVYQGVRFKTASDEGECESDTGDTTHSENISRTREAGSFPKGRVSRVTEPNSLSETPPSGWATCPKCGARLYAVGQNICKVCAARKLREVRDQTP
jgi:P4 family phage/plasmid primase-like protien